MSGQFGSIIKMHNRVKLQLTNRFTLKSPSSADKGPKRVVFILTKNQSYYCTEWMFVVRNFKNINWEHV